MTALTPVKNRDRAQWSNFAGANTLKRREPRVVVTSVKAKRETLDGENVLAIRLRYNVISTNTPGNNVILSGVEQTVILGT